MDSKNNTGIKNTGNWNTGDWNTGNWNTGSRNAGGRNTGMFNTNEPKARMFNKESSYTITELFAKDMVPDSTGFNLTVWINESDMTDKEKIENETFSCCGGYLKSYTYKEAWSNFWSQTSEENKRKFLNLPNFDSEIFKEITGIDATKSDKVEIVVEE